MTPGDHASAVLPIFSPLQRFAGRCVLAQALMSPSGNSTLLRHHGLWSRLPSLCTRTNGDLFDCTCELDDAGSSDSRVNLLARPSRLRGALKGCGALYTSNLVAERATLCCRRHHGLSLPWWFYGQRVRECTSPAYGCVERVSLGSTSTILCLDDAGSSTPVQYPRHCGSCWSPPPRLRVKVCGL